MGCRKGRPGQEIIQTETLPPPAGPCGGGGSGLSWGLGPRGPWGPTFPEPSMAGHRPAWRRRLSGLHQKSRAQGRFAIAEATPSPGELVVTLSGHVGLGELGELGRRYVGAIVPRSIRL